MSTDPADRGAPADPPDVELLPDTTSDEGDQGWGDRSGAVTDEDYLAERPPHHDR